MYRYSLGKTGLAPCGVESSHDVEWSDCVNRHLTLPAPPRPLGDRIRPLLGRRWRKKRVPPHQLDWMPTARYRREWRKMKAFAIPAYHDARIRLNVEGREAGGLVRREDYRRTLDEVAATVRRCRDLEDGRPLDVEIEYISPDDPLAVTDWQADVVFRLNRNVLGLRHPDFGDIGPVPHRRTGGHTGRHGVAYVSGRGIGAGERGLFSTFDVTPAVLDLALGRAPSTPLGKALDPPRAKRKRQSLDFGQPLHFIHSE
jgi:hypothetical protein